MTATHRQCAVPEVLGRLPMTAMMSDPYGTLAGLREASPAVPVQSSGYRVWVITRYEDVRRVLADPTVVRDLTPYGREIRSRCLVGTERLARLPARARRSFRERDGDDHHRLRSLVGHVFTPTSLAKVPVMARAIAQDLLDAVPSGQPVDLMAKYARPIAGRVICDLTGLPSDDLERLATLENDMQTSPITVDIERSAQALDEWAREVVVAKRREPRDDMCTHLLRLHEESALTEDELASTYILFMVNGMQTAAAIGNGVFAFLTHPDQLTKALAAPRLFNAAVDEVVRYEPPVLIVPSRYTTAPIELDGVTIPAGELLFIALAGGNHDPRRFDAPDDFDITRATTGHLGFGHGIHSCIGAQLAKIETSIALEMLFTRFPATQLIDPPDEANWRPGKFLRRLDTLPVQPG